MPTQDVGALLPSKDGCLWIGYESGGASRLCRGRIENYNSEQGFPIGGVRQFAIDHDGFVWVVCVDGLARLANGVWHKIRMDWNYPEKAAMTIAADGQGTLWVGTTTHIYYLLRGEKHFRQLSQSGASGSALSPNGSVWMFDTKSLSIMSVSKSGEEKVPGLSMVAGTQPFIVSHDGTFCTADEKRGVVCVPHADTIAGSLRAPSPNMWVLTKKNEQIEGSINVLFEDREANLWIGTDDKLIRLRHRNVAQYPMPQKSQWYSLVAGDNGDIWAESSQAQIPVVRVQDHRELPGVARGGSLTTYRASDGTMWFSGFEVPGFPVGKNPALWRWKHGSLSNVPLPGGKESNRILTITSTKNDDLWVSILGKGEFRLRDDEWTLVGVLPGESNMTARSAYTDDNDRVWLYYPERQKVAVLDHGITHVYSDSEVPQAGPVWVFGGRGAIICAGRTNGFSIWSGGRFKPVTRSDGIEFGTVTSVLLPASGGIWMGTSAGIIHIPEGELGRWMKNPSYAVSTGVFDLSSDLPSSLETFPIRRSGVVGSDGVLWFSSEKGIIRLDPAHILTNPIPPPVSILSLAANGRVYPASSTIDLPPSTTAIRIDYTALSLTMPERVRFKYRLEGLESQWQDAGSRRVAFYTNLQPRQYRFHVIACNNSGIWNEVGDVLELKLRPAYYQTLWFQSLYVLAALLLVWLLASIRLHYKAKEISALANERADERVRIARDLHDTLLQGFQMLLFRFQVVAASMHTSGAEMSMIEDAVGKAEQMLDEGRDRVRGLRDRGPIDIVAIVPRIAAQLNEQYTVDFRFSVIGIPRALNAAIGDEIELIVREALTNAFQHGRATAIICDVTFAIDFFSFRCSDNGRGIEASFLRNKGREGHWGIQGMYERSKKIGAALRVLSVPGRGTEVELKLPAHVAYAEAISQSHSSWSRAKTAIGRLFRHNQHDK